ncbi:MAG: MAC/perforin domain-containing protein [Methanothrix sp.]
MELAIVDSTNSEITLGYQVNILKGIKYEWDTLSGKGSPFFSPDLRNQIRIQNFPSYDPKASSFNIFELSLHYSWKELIEYLLSGWHLTDNELKNNNSPFVLVQPSAEQIKNRLCEKLGIQLDDASNDGKIGFALVRVTKSTVKGALRSIEPDLMSNDMRIAIENLPEDPTKAALFLEFFNKYGTHLVSEIEVGDMMYQVFVYDRDVLQKIEKRLGGKNKTGIDVISFQQYTQPKPQYGGYSKYAGTLNLASNDLAFNAMRSKFRDIANWIESSIFVAIRKENEYLLAQLQHVIPISCNLTSLSAFIKRENGHDNHDRNVESAFHEIFRNALYQKYGRNINPEFPELKLPFDYAKIYQAFHPPFVSTVSTSSITINQIHVDLERIVTLNPENVKNLFVFADIIEIHKDVKLPGSNITILCRKFISHTEQSRAPIIYLSENGSNSFKFYCQKFDGVADIINDKTGEHRLISHGQSMRTVTKEDGQTTVVFEDSHDINPPLALLQQIGDRTLYTLGLPLQSAQCIMNYPPSDDALTVANLFVCWLTDILKSATETDRDLLTVRAQALLLDRSEKNLPGGPLSVPYLTYEAYKPAIDKMIEKVSAFHEELGKTTALIQAKKSEEKRYADEVELNRNIQQMGEFLIKQNIAISDKEKDVVEYHNKVEAQQLTMLNDVTDKEKNLWRDLQAQQKVLTIAGPELKGYIAAYVMEQELQMIIQLAAAIGSLFAGGAGIKSITALDLKGIEKIMRQIDSAVKIIDGISKIYGAVDITTQTAIAAANGLSDVTLSKALNELSALDWTEFDAQVYANLAPLTGKVPYANTYLKEAKILSARGRAWLDAASQVSKLQYEIMLNKWQKDISQRESKRLDSLNGIISQRDFTPQDAEQIDLFELGSIYQSHEERVILKLVKTLALQDAALQYYYLQSPSQITSYDILSLKDMMANQAEESVRVMESFPSKPSDLKKPFVWILKDIKISRLLDDGTHPSDSQISRDDYLKYSKGGYDFEIPIDIESIINYVRVRILEIKMVVNGIHSTKSGKVNLRLTTAAHPFYDRNLRRETISLNAVQQSFEYVYDLKTGECECSNKPSGEFAKFFMKMTPFTRWRICLPMSEHSENVGITFDGETVDITLQFYLEAIRLSANELKTLEIS